MADDDVPYRGFASPPCFMHEIDPEYMGIPPETDERQVTDVKRWRKAERLRLLNERQKLAPKVRQTLTRQLQQNLTAFLATLGTICISGYWPIRSEPDLRDVLKDVIARGGRAALPVVAERNQPLIFRAWSPGDRLERGIWNIPTPPAEAETVRPDVLLAPFLGFDGDCYRLGHGGGYFDRTLAALDCKPVVIGVGFAMAKIPTIYPQPHDIPMSVIITESDILRQPQG